MVASVIWALHLLLDTTFAIVIPSWTIWTNWCEAEQRIIPVNIFLLLDLLIFPLWQQACRQRHCLGDYDAGWIVAQRDRGPEGNE